MTNIFNQWHYTVASKYLTLHAGCNVRKPKTIKAIKKWTKDTGLSKTNLTLMARKRLAQARKAIK